MIPAGYHCGGLVGWIRLAGGWQAPPGQGSAVPWHYTEQRSTERRQWPLFSTQRATSELEVPELDTTITRRWLIKRQTVQLCSLDTHLSPDDPKISSKPLKTTTTWSRRRQRSHFFIKRRLSSWAGANHLKCWSRRLQATKRGNVLPREWGSEKSSHRKTDRTDETTRSAPLSRGVAQSFIQCATNFHCL